MPPAARTLAPALALAALALLAAPALAGDADLTLSLSPDGAVDREDPRGLVEDANHTPGEAYAWTLNGTDDYHTVEIRVDGTFELDRPRQLVPLLDGKHFIELSGRDVDEVDRPARVFNLTGDASTFTYRLGVPGPGAANLTLHVDTEPPEVEIGEVRELDHVSFDLPTTTSEPALAWLNVTPVEGGDTVPFPTNTPDRRQTFLVQGLDPETTYELELRYEDWSGNVVRPDVFTVTTEPRPEAPTPIVEPVRPTPDATVAPDETLVEATFDGNGSPVSASGVRLFVDKQEVDHDDFTVEDGTLRYRAPAPLDEGPHSVAVEVENQAGGLGVARWSFTVEGAEPAPAPGVAALAALAGAGALLIRRGP